MGILPPATNAITRDARGRLMISNVTRRAAPPPVPPKDPPKDPPKGPPAPPKGPSADPVQEVLDLIDKLTPDQVQAVVAALQGGGGAPPAPPPPEPKPAPKGYRIESPRMQRLMAIANGVLR